MSNRHSTQHTGMKITTALSSQTNTQACCNAPAAGLAKCTNRSNRHSTLHTGMKITTALSSQTNTQACCDVPAAGLAKCTNRSNRHNTLHTGTHFFLTALLLATCNTGICCYAPTAWSKQHWLRQSNDCTLVSNQHTGICCYAPTAWLARHWLCLGPKDTTHQQRG